jgi:RNA polymerase sigma-70 factor (ECF subfamily)
MNPATPDNPRNEYSLPENMKDVVERARSGDADAFAHLYTEYFTPLYRYVYFRVTDKSYADDLTQEIFLKAYASFGKYVPATDSPLPYFYTIARNLVTDHYRKKKPVVLQEEQMREIPDTSDSIEHELANEELQVAVQAKIQMHLQKLPQLQQDALVLRFINERTNAEIGKIMGKSEVAVRQLQSRGIRSLRKRLRQDLTSTAIIKKFI